MKLLLQPKNLIIKTNQPYLNLVAIKTLKLILNNTCSMLFFNKISYVILYVLKNIAKLLFMSQFYFINFFLLAINKNI